MLARYLLSSRVRLSVRSRCAITSRYCIKTVKHRIWKITPFVSSDNNGKNLYGILMGSPPTGSQNSCGKDCALRPVENSPVQTPPSKICSPAMFIRVHDGARRRNTRCHQQDWWQWKLTTTDNNKAGCMESVDDRHMYVTWRWSIACWLYDSWAYCMRVK